jgi:hypothetical protein
MLYAVLFIDKLGNYTDIFLKLFYVKKYNKQKIYKWNYFISPVTADSL